MSDRDFAPDFTLSDAERQSQAWITIKAKIEANLDKVRKQNDVPTLTELQTAALRGHIQCLKAILALDRVVPQVKQDPAMLARPARNGIRSYE